MIFWAIWAFCLFAVVGLLAVIAWALLGILDAVKATNEGGRS